MKLYDQTEPSQWNHDEQAEERKRLSLSNTLLTLSNTISWTFFSTCSMVFTCINYLHHHQKHLQGLVYLDEPYGVTKRRTREFIHSPSMTDHLPKAWQKSVTFLWKSTRSYLSAAISGEMSRWSTQSGASSNPVSGALHQSISKTFSWWDQNIKASPPSVTWKKSVTWGLRKWKQLEN